MATYKLIQDVEAEDHIIGPLTLRQFIFAMITVFFLYLSFIFISKGVQVLLFISLPPAIFFGFFAIPFGRDQPTEIWFLAKLRFWFKPRHRIWNQSGVKELVTITAPKKIERVLTDGLSTYEVESRLKALANTLDSRGWVVKNVVPENSNYYNPVVVDDVEDRLIPIDTSNQASDTNDNLDILEPSSTVSHQFDTLIDQSNHDHREQLVQQMNNPILPTNQTSQATPSQWFMPQSFNAPIPVTATAVPATQPDINDVDLISKLRSDQKMSNEALRNMHSLSRLEEQNNSHTASSNNNAAQPDPVIMSLAKRDDLTIQTIDHVAKKEHDSQDEVVISLH